MENSWDLVRYHWEADNFGYPHLVVEEIISTHEDPSLCELLTIVTNYVNENEPHAKDFRWCNTTGDDVDWEYYQYGVDSLLTPVYSMFPSSEREELVKGG